MNKNLKNFIKISIIFGLTLLLIGLFHREEESFSQSGLSGAWHINHGPLPADVQAHVVDIDLFDTATSTISYLKKGGKKIICYVDIGTSEDWRPDFNSLPKAALGKSLPEWVGERWLDITSSDVRALISARFNLAREKGCDGIDADNMDAFMADTGFDISSNDQLFYNRWAATEAHNRGLFIGLKNDPTQAIDLELYFDFAIVESCEYDSCEPFSIFIKSGKPVIQIEYGLEKGWAICKSKDVYGFQTVVKDRMISEKEYRCSS